MSEDYSGSGGTVGGGGDSHSESTYENWFQRIGKAIGGIVVGIILVPIALVVLFWNEGRAVQTDRSLAEAGGKVVSVSADKIDPANDGKPVHLTAKATTDETLTDDTFGYQAKGVLRLIRKVEMYQWFEDKKEESRAKGVGGQEKIVTYTYKLNWHHEPIDSSTFNCNTNPKSKADRRDNPPWPEHLRKKEFPAQKATLGAFLLSPGLLKQIREEEPAPITEEDVKKLPTEQNDFRLVAGALYKGKGTPDAAKLGDLKVTFQVTKPREVSIMAEQTQNTFRPFQTSAGDKIEDLSDGNKSAKDMLKSAAEANTTLTWIIRLVGFIVVVVGICLIFGPLIIIADIIPFLGGLTGCMVFVFALFAGFGLSFLTIGIAWVAYRPMIGIPLLVVGGLGMVGMITLIVYSSKRGKALPPGAKAG